MTSIDALPKLIGHRGAAATAPENTLASLRQAHAEGASWVEFDVKLTADGVPILMHDDRLGRTTNGRGRVAKVGSDDLAKLDAGGWFGPDFAGEPVPTLKAALELCADLGLGINVELKPCPDRSAETAKKTLAMVKEMWPDNLPQPLYSSFDRPSLLTIKALEPAAKCGFLCTRVPRHWFDRMRDLGCCTLNVSNRWIRQRHIDAATAREVPVLVYTVNDPLRAKFLIDAGVTSVFTDRVKAVSAALELRADAA